MTLTTIAELLIGEANLSPGGPIDTDTAIGSDPELWGVDLPAQTDFVGAGTRQHQLAGV